MVIPHPRLPIFLPPKEQQELGFFFSTNIGPSGISSVGCSSVSCRSGATTAARFKRSTSSMRCCTLRRFSWDPRGPMKGSTENPAMLLKYSWTWKLLWKPQSFVKKTISHLKIQDESHRTSVGLVLYTSKFKWYPDHYLHGSLPLRCTKIIKNHRHSKWFWDS